MTTSFIQIDIALTYKEAISKLIEYSLSSSSPKAIVIELPSCRLSEFYDKYPSNLFWKPSQLRLETTLGMIDCAADHIWPRISGVYPLVSHPRNLGAYVTPIVLSKTLSDASIRCEYPFQFNENHGPDNFIRSGKYFSSPVET